MTIKLSEMAIERKRLIPKLEGMTDTIGNHVIKCIVYKDAFRSYRYWISEIANQFTLAGGLEVKGRIKLKSSEYQKILLDDFANEPSDFHAMLFEFLIKESKDYNPFEITDKLVGSFVGVYKELSKKVIPMISNKNIIYKQSEYEEVIKSILDEFIK